MIKDEYGVDFKDMEWFYGAVEPSAIARPEKVKLELPFKTTAIPQGKCLAQVSIDCLNIECGACILMRCSHRC